MTKINGINCLKKEEIIRGFNSFKDVLVNSRVITNGFLKLNVQVKKEVKGNEEIQIIKDPLNNVKVGFVVSKRLVRKAAKRNRLKRLLREAYRTNKNLLFVLPEYGAKILFSYNEKYKDKFKEIMLIDVNADMRAILLKAKEHIKKAK